MLKRLLCMILMCSLAFTCSPIVVYANDTTEEHEIMEDATASTVVSMLVTEDFVVTIPKRIILSGETKSGSYKVGVKGDLSDMDMVEVEPDESFTLMESAKKEVTASVRQDKTLWQASEVDTETMSFTEGSISASELTSGVWSGSLAFRVRYLKNIGVQVTEDASGNTLMTTATVIEGQTKTTLLQSLVDSEYIANVSEVSELIEVKTSDFSDTATAVFDVSRIAEPGEVVGIYHYDEVKGEWQYITKAVVDSNGTITGQFNSFSPVALVKKENEDDFDIIPGLYDANGTRLCSWKDSGILAELDYTADTYSTEQTSAYYVLTRKYPTCTEVILPSNVTKIGNYAFTGCANLEDITIPSSVISIGKYAFNNCDSIRLLTIPGSVKNIGSSAFSQCEILFSVKMLEGVQTIGNYAFYECPKLYQVVMPFGMTAIGEYAFGKCTELVLIDIPSSVTSIGKYAFWVCESLCSIVIPEGVTTIEEHTFHCCTSLTGVSISSTVTLIDTYAFYACDVLTGITLPSGITEIGNAAFRYCPKLLQITWKGKGYNPTSLKTALKNAGVTVGDNYWSTGRLY